MGRKPRQEFAGAIHHVHARGNNGELIYRDGVDRHTYLELLERVVERQRWLCLAYCLMSTHVHLLIETPEPNLAAGMHRLHSGYARVFNARHRRKGHLFERRYGGEPVAGDVHLVTAATYIAANPVDAGICARAEEWPWSSHVATVAGPAPRWLAADRLLEYFAAWGGDGLVRYRELVEARYFGGREAA